WRSARQGFVFAVAARRPAELAEEAELRPLGSLAASASLSVQRGSSEPGFAQPWAAGRRPERHLASAGSLGPDRERTRWLPDIGEAPRVPAPDPSPIGAHP